MSKKHFELLAKYINSIMDPHARLQAAVAVASACKEANQRFDQDRFFRPVIYSHISDPATTRVG
jgi:hypothetical protein